MNNKLGTLGLTLFKFSFLLIVASSIVRLASSLYLPALLDMGKDLAMSESALSFSITIFFLAYAIATIFVGPLIDALGSKKIILTGGAIFLVGSTICLISHSAYSLYFGRILQAGGASAIPVASRVLIREFCDDIDVIKVLGQLAAFGGVVTIIAPALGGIITEQFNWRYNFLFLIIISSISLIYIFKTLPTSTVRSSLNIQKILTNYAAIIKTKAFITIIFLLGFAFSLQGCFIVSTPFIFMKIYKLSPFQYGLTNIVLACSFFSGKFLAVRFIKWKDEYYATILGGIIIFLGGSLIPLFQYFHELSLLALLTSIFIAATGFGTILPIGIKVLMTIFKQQAGLISGLQGFFTLAMTSLGSGLFPFLRHSLKIGYIELLIIFIIVISLLITLFAHMAKEFLTSNQ